jgi:CheY-like chemotaxis protein
MSHKLLLADDSVTIQRVIELTFADEDVQVSAVGDGQQAIDRIEADPPDIVLADIGMPTRDGYDVAAYVKSHPTLAHIPVVLLTGAFEPIDQARAAAVGCDAVLAKPFEPQMVINRVKQLLGGSFTAAKPKVPQALVARAVEHVPGIGADVDRAARTKGRENVSLDDYFDQLDTAFAEPGETGTAEPVAAARPAAPVRPVASVRPAAEVYGQGPPEPEAALRASAPGPAAQAATPSEPRGSAPSPRGETGDEFAWVAPGEPKDAEPASLDFSDVAGLEDAPATVVRSAPAAALDDAVEVEVEVEVAPAPRVSAPGPVSARPAASPPGPIAPAVVVTAEPPPIADAFAALFDAEVGDLGLTEVESAEMESIDPMREVVVAATPLAAAAPSGLGDDLIEAVVARVLARLTDTVVREFAAAAVPEVAERLVREELLRLKSGGGKRG